MSASPLIDRAIVRFGDTVGLPHRAAKQLVKARRIVTHPFHFARRRQMARTLPATRYSSLVSNEVGYARFNANELPGQAAAMEACRTILHAWDNATPDGERKKKPFFFNILRPEDVAAYPAIVDFIASPAMIEVTSGYLRQVPRLFSMGLFVSETNGTTDSSQRFHVDFQDSRQLKCFMNLETVAPENGPLTFVAADVTKRVLRALGRKAHETWYDDEQILSRCEPAAVQALTGEAGSGAFVDTSRCLHFGSRTRAGRRAVLMLNFVPCPDAQVEKGKMDAGLALTRFPLPERVTPFQRLLLARSL